MKAGLSLFCAALATLAMLAGCRRGRLTEEGRARSFPGVENRDVNFYPSALDRM